MREGQSGADGAEGGGEGLSGHGRHRGHCESCFHSLTVTLGTFPFFVMLSSKTEFCNGGIQFYHVDKP